MASSQRMSLSMDIKQLKETEDEQLKLTDIAVQKCYATRVRKALEKLHHKKKSQALADALLKGETPLEDILKEQYGEWQGVIRNAYTEYRGLFTMAFLLLVAPKSSSSNSKLSIQQDKTARELQLNHFYNLLTRDKDTEKCPREQPIVKTYKVVKQEIHHFMERYAPTSLRVIIVFNGHGKESGHLSLEDENQEISNSRFIEDIQESWKQFRKEKEDAEVSKYLPEKVSIVLAQCYGHQHTQDPNHKNDVEVICLSNQHNPETQSVYSLNAIDNVKDSLHIELINYARDFMREESGSSSSSASFDSPDDPTGPDTKKQESKEVLKPERTQNAPGMLDIASCLLFSKGGIQTSMDQKQCSGDVLELLPKVEVEVTHKRMSEYFNKLKRGKKSSIEAMVLGSFDLAQAPLPLLVVEPTSPVKGKSAFKRQAAITGSNCSLEKTGDAEPTDDDNTQVKRDHANVKTKRSASCGTATSALVGISQLMLSTTMYCNPSNDVEQEGEQTKP